MLEIQQQEESSPHSGSEPGKCSAPAMRNWDKGGLKRTVETFKGATGGYIGSTDFSCITSELFHFS